MMIVVMMVVMATIILVLVCGRWTEFFFSWVKDWFVSIVGVLCYWVDMSVDSILRQR